MFCNIFKIPRISKSFTGYVGLVGVGAGVPIAVPRTLGLVVPVWGLRYPRFKRGREYRIECIERHARAV